MSFSHKEKVEHRSYCRINHREDWTRKAWCETVRIHARTQTKPKQTLKPQIKQANWSGKNIRLVSMPWLMWETFLGLLCRTLIQSRKQMVCRSHSLSVAIWTAASPSLPHHSALSLWWKQTGETVFLS